MAEGPTQFGRMLRQARETAGLSRADLAERVGLDPSHIYRIEVGGRRASRESALALAEALSIREEPLDRWLVAAGYAPAPILSLVRGAVRTRGGGRRPRGKPEGSPTWDSARWARWLDTMGLEETMLARVLRALETRGPVERREVAGAISRAFSRVALSLEAPVRKAVIPAAGGHHKVLAPHIMQGLLLRAIAEATESGISSITLILPPGMAGSLYVPLRNALDLSALSLVDLQFEEQAEPEGLGDAILKAERAVGGEPFAVILPDDVVSERAGRSSYARELRRMMDAFARLEGAIIAAVASAGKWKMMQGGVARLAGKEVLPGVYPLLQLVEKPDSSHAILRSKRALGIVGRYLIDPDIFEVLRSLKRKGDGLLELTDALEALRRAGTKVYGFELAAKREDVGEVLDQASELIGGSSAGKR